MAVDFPRALAKLVFPDRARPALARYLLAVALPILSIAFTNWLFTLERAPFFPLFTISVMVAAIYGGWSAGLVATAISAAVTSLALPPYFSIRVSDSESLARLAIFCAGGVLVSAFIGSISSLQQRLEIQREKLRATLASIGDAVIATDSSGNITFMNAASEEATGWTAAEALGRPLEQVFQIISEKTRATVENPIRKVFELGRVVGLANHTLLIQRAGTEIPIDDSAAPIRGSRGEIAGAVLVFRDITQQKKMDAALLQTEKLASVGRLAATIAHEINNPLEAIGNLLFLIKATRNLDEVQHYAVTAEQQLNRAASVTKQTLSFARRGESELENVAVSELVDGVLALYSNKIQGQRISVHKQCAANVWALATKSELQQVLGNLIGNALDALPTNGHLQIRVRASQCHGRATARLVVADSGYGISPEQLPKIFDAFFTTKSDIGTGLGLWVTKQIMDTHDGCIHVRSRLGRGTVVAVCWPAIGKEDVRTIVEPEKNVVS